MQGKAMVNDSENHILELWEEQPREAQQISLDEIHAKAQRFETRIRRWRTVGTPLIVLLMISNTVESVWPGGMRTRRGSSRRKLMRSIRGRSLCETEDLR